MLDTMAFNIYTAGYRTTDVECVCVCILRGFPGGLEVKNPPAKAGDMGSIPGSGRSPREGNGNPLQYSCLENLLERKKPGRLQSMGFQRVKHNLATTQQEIYMGTVKKFIHVFL